MNRKITTKMFCAMLTFAALISLAACRTPAERISAEAERTAEPLRILDWHNRGLGEVAVPEWILPAYRGDWSVFRNEWPVEPGTVLRIGHARAATRNGAMTIADVQYAARLAAELRQTVLARAGIALGSDGEFDAVNNAAVQTHVDIAGQRRLTEFWHRREITNAQGRRAEVYDFWVVYASDPAVWSQIVARYLHGIVGQLPDTRTQQIIAGMFDEINAETRIERERSEAEFQAEIEARQRALQQPMTTAEIRAAFRSNDPVRQAAAATTPADTDFVAMLAALAGMD